MKLSNEQSNIVYHKARFKQVIAGAGCGKTFTVVELIFQQILEGLDPARLMLITFTRKAADEMKMRLIKKYQDYGSKNNKLSRHLEKSFIGTFHSISLRLLQHFFPNISQGKRIINEEEQQRIYSNIALDYKPLLKGLPLTILHNLSLPENKSEYHPALHQTIAYFELKANRANAASKANKTDPFLNKLIQIKLEIEAKYQRFKMENRLIDFNDMLQLWNKSFSIADKKLKKNIINHFDLIVVDEFQDTGLTEMNFLLNIDPRKLLVVGDDWQSIYSFRKAEVFFSVNFHKFFSKSKRFYLTTNYRSSPEIIKSSNQVIKYCPGLLPKKLKPHHPKGRNPLILFGDEYHTLRNTLKLSVEYALESQETNEQLAILCRTNKQVAKIKELIQVRVKSLKVMTIHQSKGLEFDYVFIYILDKKSLPHPAAKIDEEIRLFYVAMSRAKKFLVIFALVGLNQSPFLAMLNKKTIKRLISPKLKIYLKKYFTRKKRLLIS